MPLPKGAIHNRTKYVRLLGSAARPLVHLSQPAEIGGVVGGEADRNWIRATYYTALMGLLLLAGKEMVKLVESGAIADEMPLSGTSK